MVFNVRYDRWRDVGDDSKVVMEVGDGRGGGGRVTHMIGWWAGKRRRGKRVKSEKR